MGQFLRRVGQYSEASGSVDSTFCTLFENTGGSLIAPSVGFYSIGGRIDVSGSSIRSITRLYHPVRVMKFVLCPVIGSAVWRTSQNQLKTVFWEGFEEVYVLYGEGVNFYDPDQVGFDGGTSQSLPAQYSFESNQE